ncbi:hypothetical protein ES703_83152 [subsurface metagenome]
MSAAPIGRRPAVGGAMSFACLKAETMCSASSQVNFFGFLFASTPESFKTSSAFRFETRESSEDRKLATVRPFVCFARTSKSSDIIPQGCKGMGLGRSGIVPVAFLKTVSMPSGSTNVMWTCGLEMAVMRR